MLFRGLLLCSLLLSSMTAGCRGGHGGNPPPPTRSSDYLLRRYAEPELRKLYADDPDARVEVKNVERSGKNWIADVDVTSRGRKRSKQYLLDRKGNVLEERR